MHVVFWICGGISLLGLLVELPNGGWRRVLPMVAWFLVTLPIAATLPTTTGRIAALVAVFTGAFWLRVWTAKRFPKTPET